MTKLAIIDYSATGHGTTMANRVAAAAESAGAEVRVRHVAETQDPSSFAHNPAWKANYEADSVRLARVTPIRQSSSTAIRTA